MRKTINIIKGLFLSAILFVSSFCFISCKNDIEYTEYSVTIISKFGDTELSTETLSSSSEKTIDYEPKYIIGYKFVGWEDDIESAEKTFSYSDKDKSFVANYEMDFFETPVVIINTEDSKPIESKESYIDCNITITNTDEKFEIEEVTAGIRGRGNSTWWFPKKPYRIKFDSKQSLFGSTYKQKSWTLLANYADKTLSRNAVAYEMSKQFENIEFTSIHQFVEVYLNNEYIGVYLLCDQIQTGTGRVDIDEDFYENGDTGYLIELDARAPSEGRENIDYFEFLEQYYAIKTPDTEEVDFNAELHVNFIKNYLTETMSTITNSEWDEISNYIDIDSFVDVYIIQELFYNPDVGWSSFYMYKDKGGKLYCGPIWDLDLSVNNYKYTPIEPETILFAKESNIWFKNLFLHEEFKQLVLEKIDSYNIIITSCINLLDCEKETGYYKQYEKALNRNFEKWDISETTYTPDFLAEINTVNGQMDYAKSWLENRYISMTNLITTIEY